MKKLLLLLLCMLPLFADAQTKTISEFTVATTVDPADEFLFYDVSASAPRTRKITVGNFLLSTSVVRTTGSYSNPAWLTGLAWSKLSSTPTTLAGYGVTDPVLLSSGSYADPAWLTSVNGSKLTGTVVATDGVVTTGSYSNPAWLTGLAWSKLSSTPTTLAGYLHRIVPDLDAEFDPQLDVLWAMLYRVVFWSLGGGGGLEFFADTDSYEGEASGGWSVPGIEQGVGNGILVGNNLSEGEKMFVHRTLSPQAWNGPLVSEWSPEPSPRLPWAGTPGMAEGGADVHPEGGEPFSYVNLRGSINGGINVRWPAKDGSGEVVVYEVDEGAGVISWHIPLFFEVVLNGNVAGMETEPPGHGEIDFNFSGGAALSAWANTSSVLRGTLTIQIPNWHSGGVSQWVIPLYGPATGNSATALLLAKPEQCLSYGGIWKQTGELEPGQWPFTGIP